QLRALKGGGAELLPPFSLSRLLTLWWLAIVMLSLFYAYYLTRNIDVINDTALALMGLSVAVIAGATLADRTTVADKTLDTTLATDIAALTTAPAGGAAAAATTISADLANATNSGLLSNGFWSDLLSERPNGPYDPHRIQLLVFSIAFGLYYLFRINPL